MEREVLSPLLTCNCIGSASTSSNSTLAKLINARCNAAQSENCLTDSPPPSKRMCCLKQRLGSIFDCDDSSDVMFVVGQREEKQSIRGHKLLLSLGSVVFKTMFSKKWSCEPAEIEITDVQPAAFSTLIRFLYTDEAALTFDIVIEVLYAARKYAVESLENYSVNFIVKNVRPDVALKILDEAKLLDIPNLTKACLESVDSNTVAAVKADSFCGIDSETLCLMLCRNTLTIREVQLFEAVVRWSEAQCLKKELPVNTKHLQCVARDAIQLIRFPLMTAEEFSATVAPSGLLPDDQLLSLLLHLTTKLRPPTDFNSTPRLCDREIVVNRFKECVQRDGYHYNNVTSVINFSCDHDLQLLGYGLHGPIKGAAKFKVQLFLADTSTGRNPGKDAARDFFCDGVSSTYRALFKLPIQLHARHKYSAGVHVEGPDSFFGKSGMEKVTVDLPRGRKATITFETKTKDTSNPLTTVEKGFIPQLIFSFPSSYFTS